jgi:hypothetical protein
MKERPILFSAPMVRSILAARKTQTRRIVKCTPAMSENEERFIKQNDHWEHIYALYISHEDSEIIRCPYGNPGDRLWVRETFQLPVCFDSQSPFEVGKKCVDSGYRSPWSPIKYAADGDDKFLEMIQDFGGAWGKKRVSIHMPRWASRITLEITSVKVERLQDISPRDAIAEGCCPARGNDWDKPEVYRRAAAIVGGPFPRGVFASLWQDINGPDSWDANPWVWVIEFKRAQS